MEFSRQESKAKDILSGFRIVSANSLSKVQGFGIDTKKADSLNNPNVNYKYYLKIKFKGYILLIICLDEWFRIVMAH